MGITTENLTLIDICPAGASTLPLRGGGRGGGAFFGGSGRDCRLELGGRMASGSNCELANPMASWMESGEDVVIALLSNTCAGRPNRG